MSLSELLVIVIVAILLLKPEDLPKIFAKLKQVRQFISNTKWEILTHVDNNLEDAKELAEEAEEMNYYLEKIVKIEGDYTGEYSITSLKNYYTKLVKKELLSEEEVSK